MTDIEAIRAKIRMLRTRTEAAGCTRAEAEAAAMAAMQLMAKYRIPEELADRPPVVEIDIKVGRTRLRRPWIYLPAEIGCSTACRVSVWEAGGVVTYRGFEPDAAVAGYLHAVTARIVENERRECLKSAAYKRRKTARTRSAYLLSYLHGVINELRHKLRDVVRDAGDGPDRAYRLALVQDNSQASAPFVAKGAAPDPRAGGFAAGREAGARHSIRMGVETDPPKLIGRA